MTKILFPSLLFLFLTGFINSGKFAFNKSSNKRMGISINYYRVASANKIEQLQNLEEQIQQAQETKANLYKMTEDLAIVFSNNPDPFTDTALITYRILFGHHVQVKAGWRTVNGFIPTSEVPEIVKWIKQKKIDSFEGFSDMCDKLSSATKQAMEDIGGLDKKELYSYVQLLTKLYADAERNKNSIVIIGE